MHGRQRAAVRRLRGSARSRYEEPARRHDSRGKAGRQGGDLRWPVGGERSPDRSSGRADGDWGPRIVAPETYFVAGDPAALGMDPRGWGLIPADRIVGTVQVGAAPMR